MRTGRFTKEGTITTNIAHLSAGRFAKIEFPLPPVEEQKQIVNEADRQLSAIDALDDELSKQFLRADHLRQSILCRAFQGRLLNMEYKPNSDVQQDLSIAAESPSNYGVPR
jgi:type I restriction enzyme S subunit